MLMSLLLAAAVSTPVLPPELERQARELEAMFVAPCCWSQQVSVHQSPAADEVRQDIRRRLARGETREQIINDYVVQFGERILVVPPARGYKLALYLLPPFLLVTSGAGIVVLVRRMTARRAATAQATPEPVAAGGYDARLDDELRDLD
jgi:cytochrome c-type biogenesis protein CcmH